MTKKGNTLSMHTMEQVIKDFLENSKLKESTFSRYSFICERHIIPYFEGIAIKKISNEMIKNFVQYKLENGGLKGKSLSPKTVNDITCLLLQIVKRYCKIELNINKPSYKQSEISVFSESEYRKLKTYLSMGTDSKKLGIIVAMLTGVRIGELCAIKWENIDLNAGIISITKTIQRVKNIKGKARTKIIIDTPKSKASIRTIPIPAILLNILTNFKANGNTYLLTNTPDYIEPRVYLRYFKDYLQACELKDNKFHAIRHTFATMAVEKEIDIKTLSILLGHSDVSFTMKRYVHPNMEHKRIQIEKLAIGF